MASMYMTGETTPNCRRWNLETQKSIRSNRGGAGEASVQGNANRPPSLTLCALRQEPRPSLQPLFIEENIDRQC